MSTARKILSNTFIQIGGKIFGALISVIIVKLITNFLGVEGYGQYVSVYEFLAFFGILADLGLFTIAVREIAKDQERQDFIIGNILTIRIILSLLAMLLAIVAVFLIPRYETTYIPIGVAIASISVFFSIINGTVSSVLQVHLKMQYPTLGLLVGKMVSLIYMIYVIFYGFKNPSAEGFYQLLWAGVIGNVFMVGVTWFYASKYSKIRFRYDFAYWKTTLWKTLPYGMALVLNMIYLHVGSILLLFLKDTKEVGLYGVPMRILDILNIIPVYFMTSVLPLLTISFKKNTEKAKAIVQHAFDFLAVMAMPLLIGAQILAYPLVFIVSSPEFLSRLNEGFYGSDIALQIMVFSTALAFLTSVFSFTLIALGHQEKLLWISGAGALTNVVLNFVAIPPFGFRGAAMAGVISEFVILIFSIQMVKHYFPVNLRWISALKTTFSALVMGIGVWLIRDPLYQVVENFNLFLLIPIGGLIYGTMLWITGVVNKERLALLKRPTNPT